MKASKKIEITIQTNRRLVVRGSVSARDWCRECGSETEVVTLETAGAVTQAVKMELESHLIEGDLHIVQAADGSSRVCVRSLLGLVRSARAPVEHDLLKGLLPNHQK